MRWETSQTPQGEDSRPVRTALPGHPAPQKAGSGQRPQPTTPDRAGMKTCLKSAEVSVPGSGFWPSTLKGAPPYSPQGPHLRQVWGADKPHPSLSYSEGYSLVNRAIHPVGSVSPQDKPSKIDPKGVFGAGFLHHLPKEVLSPPLLLTSKPPKQSWGVGWMAGFIQRPPEEVGRVPRSQRGPVGGSVFEDLQWVSGALLATLRGILCEGTGARGLGSRKLSPGEPSRSIQGLSTCLGLELPPLGTWIVQPRPLSCPLPPVPPKLL